MDQIPSGYLRSLTDAINAMVGDARQVSEAKVAELLASGDYETPLDLAQDLFDELEPLIAATAENAASVSAQSYDLLRMASVGEPMGATPYSAHDPETTHDAFFGMARKHATISPFLTDVMNRVDYEAKRASGETMTSNGVRDPKRPKFARIPQGPHTCQFCLMLASRGFAYYTEESAGGLTRFHENCDCKVVPQWGGESYEGYDPDEYYRQYQEALRSGELDTEQLQRASAKARERRDAEAREARLATERERLGEINGRIRDGKPVSFRAETPDGGHATYQVNTPALANLRESVSENLGYGPSNVERLADEIVRRSPGHAFEEMGHGYYSQNVRMQGADGGMNRVLLVWSMRDGRMTLVDIDFVKKGARR